MTKTFTNDGLARTVIWVPFKQTERACEYKKILTAWYDSTIETARTTVIFMSQILTLENQTHRLKQHLVWLGSNLKVRLEDSWCPQLSGSQDVIFIPKSGSENVYRK